MSWQDTGTDDPRVRVRASKSSRPRSKRRPDFSSAPEGRLVGIDRGRYTVVAEGTEIQCVKARELGRRALVVGDRVKLTGDLSGREGTLARIVQILPREHVLRRSLEEAPGQRGEKIVVANADQIVVVVAAADPPPRVGMVDRALVAADEAQIPVLLCLTKTDLADPDAFAKHFQGFNIRVIRTSLNDREAEGIEDLRAALRGKFSVLIGHSGVGKSTLINELVPGAARATGEVNVATGKGRHTSTSAVALQLPEGGWVVDTPGVRSFGLSHAETENVLRVFPGVLEATQYCLPNCSHSSEEPSCALDAWTSGDAPFEDPQPSPATKAARAELVERARALLAGVDQTDW